jgi:hypothetical protein
MSTFMNEAQHLYHYWLGCIYFTKLLSMTDMTHRVQEQSCNGLKQLDSYNNDKSIEQK